MFVLTHSSASNLSPGSTAAFVAAFAAAFGAAFSAAFGADFVAVFATAFAFGAAATFPAALLGVGGFPFAVAATGPVDPF